MAAAPVIEMPNVATVERDLSVAEKALALRVISDETYIEAANLLKVNKSLRQRIADTFADGIKKANDLHKSLLSQRKKLEDPLDRGDSHLRQQMRAYDIQKEQARRQKEIELREAERKRQEEERLREAIEVEQSGGDKEEVEEVLSAPVVVAPLIIQKETPKVEGISYRSSWKATVTDLPALIKAASENSQYQNLLLPNSVAINQLARALKGTMSIPGITVTEEKEIVNRG